MDAGRSTFWSSANGCKGYQGHEGVLIEHTVTQKPPGQLGGFFIAESRAARAQVGRTVSAGQH
jgi:hypothetical protein